MSGENEGMRKRQVKSQLQQSGRNRRELTPNLSETHRLLTTVQFADRAALLIRKRMRMTEDGPMPASKAMALLGRYDQAIAEYAAAVDAMCAAVGISRAK
jgi:hypothetical protein